MLALNDHQLQLVMTAATPLSPEKRGVFLERIAGRLRLRYFQSTASDPITDTDLVEEIARSLRGLISAA